MEIKKDIQYMDENVGRSPGKLLESLKKLSKKQGREKTLNTAFGFLMNLFREKESMLFHSGKDAELFPGIKKQTRR